MSVNNIKPPKNLYLFLGYVQKNDKRNAEGILKDNPSIANEKMYDGLQPIFFCIRNKFNKMFGLLLERMYFDDELVKNVYSSIKKQGTPKMLKKFLEHFNIPPDDPCLDEIDKKMLSQLDK